MAPSLVTSPAQTRSHNTSRTSRVEIDAEGTVVTFWEAVDGEWTVPRELAGMASATTNLLRDLGSLNGTYVNGERVHERPLYSGDEITMGSTRIVVAVDYRLAPEHPYPIPMLDCASALRGLHAEARHWQLDPERFVLTGVSAGGGLAAAVALHVRDHGGPALLGQLLVCPMLDDRNDSHSAHQMHGVGSWDRSANAVAWRAYLGEAAGGPNVSLYAAAGRALDLGGLPPTYIDVASVETFRDECVEYARLMWRCGGDAELHVWPGGNHAFDFLAPWAPLSQDARAARLAWLRRLLLRA